MDAAHGRGPAEVSAWVRRFAPRIPAGGEVLDLAAGGGRHARFLVGLGYRVTAVDRDISGLADLRDKAAMSVLEFDLEDGRSWPLAGHCYAGIVVTNYLFRPLLPAIIGAVAPQGCLIYETFAVGNERFGKPSSPDFLLRPGELLEAVRGRLTVLAYENLEVSEPRPAVLQRIAAVAMPSKISHSTSPI
jgi:SAM-dependent methyltransferase